MMPSPDRMFPALYQEYATRPVGTETEAAFTSRKLSQIVLLTGIFAGLTITLMHMVGLSTSGVLFSIIGAITAGAAARWAPDAVVACVVPMVLLISLQLGVLLLMPAVFTVEVPVSLISQVCAAAGMWLGVMSMVATSVHLWTLAAAQEMVESTNATAPSSGSYR